MANLRAARFFSGKGKFGPAHLCLMFTLFFQQILVAQNVGIGTTTPTEKLEVGGNIKVGGNIGVSNGGEIRLENSHIKGLNTLEGANGLFLRPAAGSSSLVSLDLDGNLTLSNAGSNPNIFGVNALRGTPNGLHLQGDANSTSDLFIHPNGSIGIGNVPNPTHLLQVNGGLRVESEVSVGGGGHFLVDAFGVPGGRFTILDSGQAGFRHAQSNIALNVRSQAGDDIILNVEGATLSPVLQVENDGEVKVTGNFFVVNGSKNFLTDHPLDPANKTLQHACVESNEVLNIYSGTVLLNGQGKATIALPDYCEALNKDFRYMLTSIGSPAPNLHIFKEITNNRFDIAGGMPGAKVSWQVTGVRNDAWFRDHPYQAVQEKTGRDRGRYFYPAGFG